jgi:hypothetical protein
MTFCNNACGFLLRFEVLCICAHCIYDFVTHTYLGVKLHMWFTTRTKFSFLSCGFMSIQMYICVYELYSRLNDRKRQFRRMQLICGIISNVFIESVPGLFVVVSWISFLVPSEVIPGSIRRSFVKIHNIPNCNNLHMP